MYAQFNFTILPARLFSSRKSMLLVSSMLLTFMLNLFATSINAQCYCTAVYSVGSTVGKPTLTSAIAAYGAGFASPGAVCIQVQGQFDVDASQTWTLTGTKLSFSDPNSSLFVLGGSTLNAQSTSFRPCVSSSSWLGVYVQTGAFLSANQCTFILADNAGVAVMPNSTFRLTNSSVINCSKGLKIVGNQTPANHTVSGNTFQGCKMGIQMGAARNVSILSNIYIAFEGQLMTGVHMESVCENITITGGNFTNLQRGVSSVKTINLDVSNAIIRSTKIGVFSTEGSKTLNVRNCNFVSNIDLGIYVFYHNTDATAVNGDVLLDGNTFTLQQRQNNILVDNLGGSGQGTIKNNIISLPQNVLITTTATQYGIQVEQAYAKKGVFIENNQLKLPSVVALAPGGILVNRCTPYCLIRNNTVQNNTLTNIMPTLIHANACATSVELVGNSVNGGAGISDKGISVENCPDKILLCCNTLTNTNSGLYIKGPLNGSLIYNTVFGNHPFAALHYDQISSTGAPQVNHGNDWSSASGMWDAYFDGSGAAASTVNYEVNAANLPNLLTKINVTMGAPSDWFAVNHDGEPSCSNTSTSYCGQEPGDKTDGGDKGEGGRSQQTTRNDLAIYPNPADQSLFVSWSADQVGNTEVILRDGLGRAVLQQQVSEGVYNLNLPTTDLPAGMYLLQLRQNGQPMSMSKVMIQH